jgi:hypothetical protein
MMRVAVLTSPADFPWLAWADFITTTSESRFSVHTHGAARPRPHAKAAKVPLDGSPLRCVCVEVCCAERCSNVAVPACHRTHSLNEALVRCQCVGPTIPDGV